jgi:hypothetical protein
MPSASQFAPRPASPQSATPRRLIRQRISKLIFSAAIIASATAFIAPLANAQDLGEIARQERAKKQNNPAPPATHVYTNEDVKREEILTPEDKTRFSATTQPAAVKPSQSAPQLASESTPLPGNANLPIGAFQTVSTAPTRTSPPTQTSLRQSAHQQTNQAPAHLIISSAPTLLAKTNSAPPTRATNSVAGKISQPAVTQVSTPAPVQALQPPFTKVGAAAHATAPTSLSQSIPQRAQIPGNADRLIGALPPTHPMSATPEPAAIEPAVISVAQSSEIQFPTTILLDQMPLGDVARYYRAKKQQNAEATARASASPVTLSVSTAAPAATLPSAPTSPTTEPFLTAAALDQMPLGDVARYYRAKKREENQAIAIAAASAPANNPTPPISESPAQLAPTRSAKRYPLTIAAMPLASMKPRTPSPNSPPLATSLRRRNTTRTSPIVPTALPKRAVSQTTSIRIVSGDTLWQLARKYLGTGTRWHELVSLNPNIQDPRQLQIGAQLILQHATG